MTAPTGHLQDYSNALAWFLLTAKKFHRETKQDIENYEDFEPATSPRGYVLFSLLLRVMADLEAARNSGQTSSLLQSLTAQVVFEAFDDGEDPVAVDSTAAYFG